MAAEQDRLRGEGHLVAADREGRPVGARRQHVDAGLEHAHVRRRRPGDAETELEQGRVVEQVLAQHLQGEAQVSGVEDLQFRLDAEFANPQRAPAEHVGRGNVDEAAFPEVVRAAVQRADLGQQFLDVGQALHGTHEVRVLAELGGGLVGADHQVAAHSRGEVDDDVGVAVADPRHHFPIERNVATSFAGGRVAHMAVHDRRPGLGGVEGRSGDLGRRNGYVRVFADRVAGPGYRAGDHDFGVHVVALPWTLARPTLHLCMDTRRGDPIAPEGRAGTGQARPLRRSRYSYHRTVGSATEMRRCA